MTRNDLWDIETAVNDIANAAELVRVDTIEAMAGESETVVIPAAIHWGLLQVLDRARALRKDFYLHSDGEGKNV